MRLRTLVLAAALAGAGCGHVAVRGAVYVPAPQVAYLGPDLYVVADANRPIFFADNWYWMWNDGVWYRSTYWDRGWVYVDTVPNVIATITTPWIYVHWQRGPYYLADRVPRGHHGPYVRPHPAGNRVPPWRDHRTTPRPTPSRDHRTTPPPRPAPKRDHRTW